MTCDVVLWDMVCGMMWYDLLHVGHNLYQCSDIEIKTHHYIIFFVQPLHSLLT